MEIKTYMCDRKGCQCYANIKVEMPVGYQTGVDGSETRCRSLDLCKQHAQDLLNKVLENLEPIETEELRKDFI